MKPEVKGLLVALAVAVMAVTAYFIGRANLEAPNPGNSEFERRMATIPVPKVWYEGSRTVIVSEGEDVARTTMWGLDSFVLTPNQRAYVTGQFAASEPERVIFVVMDATNYERMTQGYPPLVLYASRTSPVRFPMPAGEYWCGFVAIPPKEDTTTPRFPTSVLDLGLWIIAQGAKQEIPPVRINLQLERVVETFGVRTPPNFTGRAQEREYEPQS